MLRDVRKKCVVKDPELGKHAALALREVLVFVICCTGGLMGERGFEKAMQRTFARHLDPELRTQLHCTRTAIGRIGQDRTVCERAAPRIFHSAMSAQELKDVFAA